MQAMTKNEKKYKMHHCEEKVNFRVQNPCRDKELLSNTRCNPVNFNFNDGSEGFKNAAKAQEKTEERNLP